MPYFDATELLQKTRRQMGHEKTWKPYVSGQQWYVWLVRGRQPGLVSSDPI